MHSTDLRRVKKENTIIYCKGLDGRCIGELHVKVK
jgi:hypothetical protein